MGDPKTVRFKDWMDRQGKKFMDAWQDLRRGRKSRNLVQWAKSFVKVIAYGVYNLVLIAVSAIVLLSIVVFGPVIGPIIQKLKRENKS